MVTKPVVMNVLIVRGRQANSSFRIGFAEKTGRTESNLDVYKRQGDICVKKVRQVATAVADGAIAGIQAAAMCWYETHSRATVDAALYQALNLVRQIRLSWKRGNAIDTIGCSKKAIAEYIKNVLAEEQIPFKGIGGWLK